VATTLPLSASAEDALRFEKTKNRTAKKPARDYFLGDEIENTTPAPPLPPISVVP